MSTNSMSTLVKALAAPSAQETRSERWTRRFSHALRIFAIVVFLVCVCIGIGMLWWAWHTGAWDDFFFNMLYVVQGLLIAWRVPEIGTDARKAAVIREGGQELRRISAQADDRLAPVVEPQPEPLDRAEAGDAVVSLRIAPSHPVLMSIVYGLGALLCLFMLGMVALLVWLLTFIPNPPDHQPLDWWEAALAVGVIGFVITVCLGFVAYLAHLALRAWRQRHNNRYTLDAMGLRRGEGPGTLTIPWHDVRAFYRIEHRDNLGAGPVSDGMLRKQAAISGNPRFRQLVSELEATMRRSTAITYVLDAGERVLTWTIGPREKPANAVTYECLWHAISAHTRLPLRDLTGQAAIVLRAAAAAKKDKPIPALPGQSQTEAVLAGLPGRSPQARLTRAKAWKRTLTLAPLVAILVLCGGGWVLQQVQHALYNSLPARIHAQTPRFTDAFAADDGNWPVHPATADDAAYGYAKGKYKISDGWGEALLSRTYGDAAVEVTVQVGFNDPKVKMGDFGQVGVVVRAGSSPESMVVFAIGPLGDWSLMRYRDAGPEDDRWQVLGLGDRSSAIHTGFGPNRLLVLMRGSEYLCYANDQLVAVAHDDALTHGQVGLWLEQKTMASTATVGYFSHFTVYPAV